MGLVVLRWVSRVVANEVRVYRSESPMDPEALPAELVTLAASALSYEDGSVVVGTTYYYRVAAVLTGSPDTLAVSDQVSIVAQAGAGGGSPAASPSPGFDPLAFYETGIDGFYIEVRGDTVFADTLRTTPALDTENVAAITDLSGNGNHPRDSDAARQPAYIESRSSLNWSGTRVFRDTDFVDISDTAGTIAARFRADTAGSGTRVVCGTIESTPFPRCWLSITNGVLSAGIGQIGSDSFQDPGATDIRSATVFHSGCVSWDETTARLYLDGVEVANAARDGRVSANEFFVGARQKTGGQDLYWDGDISDIMVVEKTLTAGEVEELHDYWVARHA